MSINNEKKNPLRVVTSVIHQQRIGTSNNWVSRNSNNNGIPRHELHWRNSPKWTKIHSKRIATHAELSCRSLESLSMINALEIAHIVPFVSNC